MRMLLRQSFWCMALLGGVWLTGCRESTEPERAAALLGEVRADDYRSWDRAPGFDTAQPSRAAHDDEVIIYVNDVVATALAGTESITEWPVGSVIVKEGFSGSDLGLIAITEKTTDGTWFWAEYGADGDVLFSGAPTICLGCHQIGDDFVRGFFFP